MYATSEFRLTNSDNLELNSWLRSTSFPQGLITRAKILLSLDEGITQAAIAHAQGVSRKTTYKYGGKALLKRGWMGFLASHAQVGQYLSMIRL